MRILEKIFQIKSHIILFLGAVAVTVAIYFLTTPMEGTHRRPAQVNESSVDFEDVKEFKRKIISTLKIEKRSSSESFVKIILPAEVCQKFQRFDLVLEAEGVALNGEPLQITESKTCLDLDSETLEMKWLISSKDQPQLVDTVVEVWNLKGLAFVPRGNQPPLRITGYEFIYVLGAPPSVQLKP